MIACPKIKNKTLMLVLVLGVIFLALVVKNGVGEENRNIGYATAKSEKQTNMEKEYGGCSYYKAQTDEMKKSFMRDLEISSDKDLAAFLEDLKNNPDKRKEFRSNKKSTSYNVGLLLYGEENNGNEYPGDLENYEEAVKNVCDPKGGETEPIKTNIEIIKILTEGLESYKIPKDETDKIWPKEYLEKEQ